MQSRPAPLQGQETMLQKRFAMVRDRFTRLREGFATLRKSSAKQASLLCRDGVMSPQVMMRGEIAQKPQIFATPRAIKSAGRRLFQRLPFNDLGYEESSDTMICTHVFLLVVCVVSIITLVAWRLPKGTKLHGLASAWRWIIIASTLYMGYYGSDILPHYMVISPLLWYAFVVLMCCAVFSAARQNCKPVWGRLLAGLLLDIAIYIILIIIYY